uniref:Secreted protein n=1 Tax=Mesocestoides corti TaxID=53468 RepID=A0A5K3EKX1_MESCO
MRFSSNSLLINSYLSSDKFPLSWFVLNHLSIPFARVAVSDCCQQNRVCTLALSAIFPNSTKFNKKLTDSTSCHYLDKACSNILVCNLRSFRIFLLETRTNIRPIHFAHTAKPLVCKKSTKSP